MHPALTDILNSLLTKPNEPTTIIRLEGDYEAFLVANPLPDPVSETACRKRLRAFLREGFRCLLEAAELAKIEQLVLQYERLVAERASVETLANFQEGVEPSYADVQKAVTAVYEELQWVQQHREVGHNLLTVLRRIGSSFAQLRKAGHGLVVDADFEERLFVHLSDRKRFLEAWEADVQAYETQLQEFRNRIVQLLETVLPARSNLLMRTDSAIRLLCKMNEPEGRINSWQSRGHTTPAGVSRDIGTGHTDGFVVEPVNPS